MMADIARYGHGEPVVLKDIADRQKLPKLYLSQLAAPLKSASLLKSVWGNRGGYTLGRGAGEISLLEIMEAVEGPVGVLDCVLDPGACERSDYCECIGVWREINEAVKRILSHYTLADIAGRCVIDRRLAVPELAGIAAGEVCHEFVGARPGARGKDIKRQDHPPRKK